VKSFVLFLSLLSGVGSQNAVRTQEATPAHENVSPVPPGLAVSTDENYRVGPGDLLEISILRLPEISRGYWVTAQGTIELPFVGRIKVQEKTGQELAVFIADRLRGDYLVDPQVSIIVRRATPQFFIQGAVRIPGVYSLESAPTLLELITISGGLNATYGATAFIVHKSVPSQQSIRVGNSATADAVLPEYELRKASINALLRGDFSENVTIEPNDIVHIPPADVFFVAGEVKAPGSFALKEGTTLRQAISLAQGSTPTAAPTRAIIFRENSDGQKREIPVDVSAVMRGRNPDMAILANDIIVVPNSKTKSVFVPIVNAFGVNAAYAATKVIAP
jgi:polysaccharide biosynthesis/export protein